MKIIKSDNYKIDNKKELIEELSNLEHKQWMLWAKDILKSEDISEEREDRWEEDSFDSYKNLSEKQKDMDREWAEKVYDVVKKYIK